MKTMSKALGAVIALSVFSVQADTWHLTASASTDAKKASYHGSCTNAVYWTNDATGLAGEPGVPLNASDTYIVDNDRSLSINSGANFGGGHLVIGDLSSSFYENRLYWGGHIGIVSGGDLTLARGYATHGTSSTSNYNLNAPTFVTSPKATPFGITSSGSATLTIYHNDGLHGDSTVGLIIGGRYDGSKIIKTTSKGVTYNLNCLDNYHGALNCVSADECPTRTSGNVTVKIGASPQFGGMIEAESGVNLYLTEEGEVNMSDLTLHDDTIIRYTYANSTTSVIRVSNSFTIPEADGKVRLYLPDITAGTSEKVYPLIIVPYSQELDLESFEVMNVTKPLWAEGRLELIEDGVAGTKSLVWRNYGVRKLASADSTEYTKNGSTYTSALSVGSESKWSPAELPSAGNVYEWGQKSNYGNCIRTPWDATADYVFPGEALHATGEQAILVMANSYGFDAKIKVDGDAMRIRVYNGKSPKLNGVMHLNSEVVSLAYNSSVLTVNSRISGAGNWTISGYTGTSSPNATTWFTGDNSEWTGTISVNSLTYDKGTAPNESKHQTIGATKGTSLGGRLEELDYKALTLLDFSTLSITNDLTLASDLNRGLFVTNNAIFTVNADRTFTCNWPITMNGTLIKKSAGTLALGGAMKFIGAEGAVVDMPGAEDDRRTLNVKAGVIKPLAAGCLDGALVSFASGTKLALDFNPADADLKRYGLYNVKTETPFAEAKTISIQLDNVDADALAAARQTPAGYKQGLITVQTAAADAVEANLSFAPIWGLKVIREDDPETHLTTFSVYGKDRGTVLIFR